MNNETIEARLRALAPQTAPPPQFPMIGLNTTREGMQISAILAPGMSLNLVLGEDAMNQATTQWIKTRQEIQQELTILQSVQRSKQ